MPKVELILTTFDWVPEMPQGYVRDIRVRWGQVMEIPHIDDEVIDRIQELKKQRLPFIDTTQKNGLASRMTIKFSSAKCF